MKLPLRDHLTIAAALLAILLCGYGIGFLVGERTTQNRLSPPADPARQQQDWETATLARLTTELGLSTEQRLAVEQEIHTTSKAITEARNRAVGDYRHALLDLHQRLLPHLNESQRRKIEQSRRSMQELLDAGE